MKLSQLLLKTKLVTSLPDMEISGLTSDSRKVQKGFLFAALSGVSFDGRQFIESAIQNEASAILSDDISLAEKFPDITFLKSENPHRDFALLAAAFYHKQPSHIAAVTGTNGKTSIADFTRQVLNMMNKKAASLGTLGLIKNNEEPQYAMTTPDPITLHQDLAELRDEGIDYLVMETSSHGLCQYRVGGIEFEVAGFTNLTRDHLDYHKTMENYFNAKKMLFTTFLKKGGSAVLNADCDVFMPLKEACLETGKKVIAYGRKGDVIRLIKSQALAHGQKLKLEYYGKKIDLEIPLAGEFQAMNVLCALGMLAELTHEPFEVIKYISKIHGAKGRLELVGQTAKGAAIYIDYAHTPDGLENILRAARELTPKDAELICMFGCGGDRDATKRPKMGLIAQSLSDKIVVTSDNPRSEDPQQIITDILSGLKLINPKTVFVEPDRHLAIELLKKISTPKDVIILAGKGHEDYQILKDKTIHFDDREEVQKVFN